MKRPEESLAYGTRVTESKGPGPILPTTEEETWLTNNFVGPQPQAFDEFSKRFESVLKLGLEFKTNAKVNQSPKPVPATKTFQEVPAEGVSFESLLDYYNELAMESTNWASPNFMGFPDAGNSLPALSAAMMVPFLNQNLANQEICSPSATFVEMELVHWLRGLVGYIVKSEYRNSHDTGGTLTLGGCLSNTVALMAAREKYFPGSRLHGLPVPAQQMCVLVPDIIEHYSIRSAMAWLGMGEKQVVRVPVDGLFRMRVSALETCIDVERANGRHIIACCAYAGDSRTMCVDNLADISQCLKKKNIWFHVDACHGFQLAFSKKHKHKLNGIEMADSVTIDPHKVMWTPTTCSLVLFRNPKDLSNVSTDSDLILKTQWSLGQITPFIGSKAFDSLKLWSVIKYFGSSTIGHLVDSGIEMTREIQRAVREKADLVLLNETDINSCIFQYIPQECQKPTVSVPDLEKINILNQQIKTNIMAAGDFYLHGFMLKSLTHPLYPEGRPVYVLRTLNGNALTTVSNVDALLNTVVSYGQKALKETNYLLKPERPLITGLNVIVKLRIEIGQLLGAANHAAVVYGSTVCADKFLFSDIDLMTFAPDNVCTPEMIQKVIKIYQKIMVEEDFLLDDEVPLHRKLLIPFSVARKAAQNICQLEGSTVLSIPKTEEFLQSETMILRLVFNVLSSPTFCVSGDSDIVQSLRTDAEATLLEIATKLNPKSLSSPESFVTTLLGDGTRSGESYLGYKNRVEVVDHLRGVWSRSVLSKGLSHDFYEM